MATLQHVPQPLVFERVDPATALQRSEWFLEQMRRRRSVRHFSSEPVAFELIENAIATAGTSPSGANQQPWTFVVVGDPALKREIREAAEAEERRTYGGRASRQWLDAIAPIGTDWHKPHLTDAPYVIVVFEQAFAEDGADRRKHYYVRESVGIAVGMLLVSLHLAGLATLTHSPSPMGFLSRILERPRNERPLIVIPVGYPTPDATVPDLRRKTADEIAIYR